MTTNGAIRPGYPWACEIEFTGETFPPEARFRAQFRNDVGASVLADVSTEIATDGSGIEVRNANTLAITLSAEKTLGMKRDKVVFDIARIDVEPYVLRAEFIVAVKRPVTRLGSGE